MDPYAVAREFVDQRYPDAQVAILDGSAASGAVTPTSDLDILIVLSGDSADVSYVETTTHRQWLIEAFVYGSARAREWFQRGHDERRPVLDSLAANGLAISKNEETVALAKEAREVIPAGPKPLGAEELDLRRYKLSAWIDDLEGS
ncbi:nucleotidyltransferase domain-containing protein [Phytoactinopolyspora alkaliphila]|nr:nucleotidyltransferase domain-containing protein [Phytoactinopolyspora alkaliphila]